MDKNSGKLVVLGVCAHPDDLDAGAGGTFAKWAKEGAECHYLICTDGGRGSVDPTISSKKLMEIRKKEQLAAGKILGLKGVHFLDYKDMELVPDMGLKRDIVKYIRKLKPDVVVTTDPTFVYSKMGFINHSDHRAAGLATIDAIYPLAKNSFAFKELERAGLKPHRVKVIYLINFAEGNEFVDISKTMDLKVRAIAEHRTQGLSRNAEMFRRIGGMVGKKAGYKYAELFVKIDLEHALNR
ncbi:MAG: PIG-L family deacetylase [Candidatus Micrarchaeota archaeon]|nr:PIG-L family deacetylase [Candidatus Micrarchaeota archaeon]